MKRLRSFLIGAAPGGPFYLLLIAAVFGVVSLLALR